MDLSQCKIANNQSISRKLVDIEGYSRLLLLIPSQCDRVGHDDSMMIQDGRNESMIRQ